MAAAAFNEGGTGGSGLEAIKESYNNGMKGPNKQGRKGFSSTSEP